MRYLLQFIIVIVCQSCITQKPGKFIFSDGEFQCNDCDRPHLILEKKKFFIIDQDRRPVCCDTLSKGVWKIDKKNKLLYLTSSPEISSEYLLPGVTEMTDPHLSDSIYIKVVNPIQSFFSKPGKRHIPVFDYQINIEISNKKDGFSSNNVLVHHFSDTSTKIFIPKNAAVDSMDLIIWPKYYYIRLKNVYRTTYYTKTYRVKNKLTNSFEISIEDLTYEYLAYIRLNEDIVKIIDNNTLEWDGHIYKRILE